MNELALFAGAGGGLLASEKLGWQTICAVELDEYCRRILIQRQNDGSLQSKFPIWDDVCTFDARPWRGRVDVVTGGFPCQDISSAGSKEGISGKSSGLWRQMARIVCEVRPRFVFVENSAMLTARGLGTVLADLAAMGFNARWGMLGASAVGAPHRRNRLWIMAYTNGNGFDQRIARNDGSEKNAWSEHRLEHHRRSGLYATPGVCRMADGVAYRLDRLKAIGNGQVPQCAAKAWELLSEMH